MTLYSLHVNLRGFELYKSDSENVDEILEHGELLESGYNTYKAQEAFLEDREGRDQCVEIFESEVYQTPPSDWTARKGHQVMVCETALSFEF